MSDSTPTVALPPRPVPRRGTVTRAQRLAAQAEAMAGATEVARRVIGASFGTVPDTDSLHPDSDDAAPACLRVHVTCDMDGAQGTSQPVPPREIDIAVTVRVAPLRARARHCLPDMKAA